MLAGTLFPATQDVGLRDVRLASIGPIPGCVYWDCEHITSLYEHCLTWRSAFSETRDVKHMVN